MRYRSFVADSARWDNFEFRAGDIIISTPPKCGTTWTQMLVALLVFDGPVFPAPLELVSPWVDMQTRPLDEVLAACAAQTHRRFVKTHTPLDGLPQCHDVTYVVVARDPLDAAVSMMHHRANTDLDRFIEVRAAAVGLDDLAELAPPVTEPEDPADWLRAFFEGAGINGMGNLGDVAHHVGDAWSRRELQNVALFHYADFRADLPAELCRLGAAIGIELSSDRAHELAAEASITRMRERAAEVVPNASNGQWHSTESFLRSGHSGEGRSLLTDDDLARIRSAPRRPARSRRGGMASPGPARIGSRSDDSPVGVNGRQVCTVSVVRPPHSGDLVPP